MLHHPPHPSLFPYTTLFRSQLRIALTDIGRDDKVKIALAEMLLSESLSDPPLAGRVDEAQTLLDSLSLRVGTSPDVERKRIEQRSEEHTSELQSRRDLVCRL